MLRVTRLDLRSLLRCCALIALAATGTAVHARILAGQQPPVIPLRPGLTIVKAISNPKGDYESIDQIDAIDAQGIHFHISYPDRNLLEPKSITTKGSDRTAKDTTRLTAKRTVLKADLDSARHYQPQGHPRHPEIFPGTTALGTSAIVLNELKAGDDAWFYLGSANSSGSDWQMLRYLEGLGKRLLLLRRVETKPITVSVLVNNMRVDLPAIHARGRLGNLDCDFYFLDDAQNPLALRWQIGEQGYHVIKISFPSAASTAQLASALKSVGRAEVYGIYFDVGSAVIKPESEMVLKEIAEVLGGNPGWKLDVEGHTDNVGGDAYNLELSRQRAAAVKDALVSRHRVAAQRLSTTGFGASRSKEPNETLAGRARNRRVELVRR